jgi:hypothetical protein
MTASADHGQDGNGESLAVVLRAGNAGSNTAADHIEAARLDNYDFIYVGGQSAQYIRQVTRLVQSRNYDRHPRS